MTTRFCEFDHQLSHTIESMISMRGTSSDDLAQTLDQLNGRFTLTLHILSPCFAAYLCFWTVLWFLVVIRELNMFSNLISSAPAATRLAAQKPIRLASDKRAPGPSGSQQRKCFDPLFQFCAIFCFLMTAVAVVLIVIELILLRNTASEFQLISTRLQLAHKLTSQMLGAIYRLIMIQVLEVAGHPPEPVFGGMEKVAHIERLDSAFEAVIGLIYELVATIGQGDGRANEATMDRLLTKEHCDTDSRSKNGHEAYRCAGLITLMNLMIQYISEARQEVTGTLRVKSGDEHVGGQTTSKLLHIASYHFMGMMFAFTAEAGTIWPPLAIDDLQSQLLWCLIGGLISVAAGQVALFLLRMACNDTYDGLKMVLRRLDPAAVVAHKALMMYLLNKKIEAAEGSATSQILTTSQDAIVTFGKDLLIDTVNGGVTAVLGYSAEQTLGQSITMLFIAKDGERLRQQAEMMLRGESRNSFTGEMKCLTEQREEISAAVTLLSIGGPKSRFVVTVRDISALAAQREQAEVAKVKNEELLYEILPRAIVAQLNQGKQNISFVVESATLAFIDIEKFSDCTAMRTPAETLRLLASIFGGYDAHIGKYPLCLKMKFVGDCYMMAAGLFDPNAAAAAHAEQAVRFGQDCLQVIDDVNKRLSMCLAVRIGVNTGGPLTAGVLGTSKPLFDILGDPINIAARLQSSGPAGEIQISEETYELLRGCTDLRVRLRGEVMLKGKGLRRTYLVERCQELIECRAVVGFHSNKSGQLLSGSGGVSPGIRLQTMPLTDLLSGDAGAVAESTA
jgi:PAS domain S-box-containing protein